MLTLFAAPARAATPIESFGCPQLQLALEAPEIEIDDRMILKADQVLLVTEGQSRLAGGVTLSQGGQFFSTEAMRFDREAGLVTVDGESLFRNPNLIVKSGSARFDLNQQSGSFENTEFTLPGRAARGTSERVEVNAESEASLRSAAYTTCARNSDAWYLKASKIKLDHEEGLGSARNARLQFMGVPVLYLPYFQFPINNERRTGLLYPTIGQLSGSGLDFRWPVYINLAPNYDATVTPRFMSDRGIQPGIELRYLLASGVGSAQYEYLDDRKFGQDRSLLRLEHVNLVNDRLSLEANYAETSDRHYFEDLGGSFTSASQTHLEQTALLTYRAPGAFTISAMVQNFQPVASNLIDVDDPYKRLPQVRLDTTLKNTFLNTRAGLGAEYVNFTRVDSVEGARIIAVPYLQYSQQIGNWYTRGQADLHLTQYELSGLNTGAGENPSRALPILSLETGLRFERLMESGRLQTLTPRGIALYVPFEDQDDIPLFDTGEPDFDFVQLFARNRFSGQDRIADARHVAGEVTLREIDLDDGQPVWSASLGQIFRLSSPRVGLPDESPPDRGADAVVSQLTYRLFENWHSIVAGQWSPEDNSFERTQLGLRYRGPLKSRQLNVSYRFRRDLIEQADVSFSTPVIGPWSLAARTRFSLRDNRSRENFVGVEYSTCCWAIRTSWRRYIGDVSGDFDSGVYVQLQLKGLGNIGSGGETLLPEEEVDGEVR